MAKFALIFSILLMLGSAALNFMTHGKLGAAHTDLEAAKATADSASAAAQKAKGELKPVQDALMDANSKLDTANRDVAAAKQQLDSATNDKNDLQKKYDELVAQGPKGPQTPEVPVQDPRVEELTKKLQDTQASLAELQQVNSTLVTGKSELEVQIQGLKDEQKRHSEGILKPGLEGQVLAVNHGWNFVVLSIGDHQGAVANAEMIITRGGNAIGKVRITSVEPATSVADIVPGSLAKGVRIQPGDRVIFPNS